MKILKFILYCIGQVFLWLIILGLILTKETPITPIIGTVLAAVLLLRPFFLKKVKKQQQEAQTIINKYHNIIEPEETIKNELSQEIQKLNDSKDEIQKFLTEKNLEKDKLENEIIRLSKTADLGSAILNLEENHKATYSKLVELRTEKNNLENEISKLNEQSQFLRTDEENKILNLTEANNLIEATQKLEKQLSTQKNKLERLKNYQTSITYAIEQYFKFVPEEFNIKVDIDKEIEQLMPNTFLHLHSMDMAELRKAFKENEKQIDETLNKISNRYTTKTNIMIYKLMVIALKSELQNVLYNLKYDKLEKAIQTIKEITNKYLSIANEGNQTISGTMAQFIGVLEYQFINAVKIEYQYYIRQEQIKQQQIAIRQQMKEEAEERKALKLEKERIEKEEQKYKQEIERTQEILDKSQDNLEIEKLKAKILELQGQLTDVVVKKDEVINLQNGKAGNIYIISNLGSFGENIFKIGMTRRLNPLERINELGSASVPFKFDVHSFIFSNNAVELEKEIHNKLNDKRVNKVNLRKEFFYSTVDELEKLVNEIDPSAEFVKTMLAEEFNQTASATEIDNNYNEEDDIEEIAD